MSTKVDVARAATEAELERVLEAYALGQLRALRRAESGYVNDNWIVETGRGRYFLKHRHPGLCRPDVIRAQHALVAWLRQAGFPAPTLVSTARGETLLLLDGECYEVQGYIEGHLYGHDRSAHLAEAAATLGRYHDDSLGHVEAARALGLHAIHFTTAEALAADLDHLLAISNTPYQN
ncbi:MAG: phosphotransferase [Chloroflexi bacterium]|nr:phosphotransferase [Chloroflexota bacterium]